MIKVYNVAELSDVLRLTPQSVRRFIKEGRIRARKVGTRWLVTEDALRLFLEGGTPVDEDAGDASARDLEA